MRKQVTIQVLLILAIAMSSCKKATIDGRVFDVFGNPVNEATVTVVGTQFTSQTNSTGNYSVEFVPGDIKVSISKPGFTETFFDVKITTKSTFPAENKVIYEIPKEPGIWFLDLEKKQYSSVKNTKTMVRRYQAGIPLHMGEIATVTDFVVELKADNCLPINVQGDNVQLTFLDNDNVNQKLINLGDLGTGNLLQMLHRNDSWENIDFREDEINIIKEEITDLGNGVFLRKITLQKGNHYYAFVNYNRKDKHPIYDPVYLFSY